MKIHAGFTDTILIGLDNVPVAIESAGSQIVQGITIGSLQYRQLAPVDVTGNEHHSVGFGLVDQIDELDELQRKVRP